jgi:cell division protein FtsB
MTIDPRQWKYRRRAVFLILIASLFIIGICAVYGGEDAVRVATVNALSFLIALVAVFYIFTPSLEAGWQVLAALVGRKAP